MTTTLQPGPGPGPSQRPVHPAAPDASDVVVRDATAADHAGARAALVASFAQFRPHLGGTLHDLYLADLCDLDHRLRDARLLVATADDVVVGTVTLHPDASAGELNWGPGCAAIRALGVDPRQRGRGIARQLVEAAAARALDGGAHNLVLHTAEFMTAAIGLYERMGFTRVPDLDIDAARLIDTEGERAPRVLAYRMGLDR